VLASGYGGQLLAVIPARRLVIVQTVDLGRRPAGVRTTDFLALLHKVLAAAPP